MRKNETDIASYLIIAPRDLKCNTFRIHMAPNTIDNYYKNKEHGGWPEIVGVLKTGTKLKCIKVTECGALFFWDSYINIYAEIMEGPYQGIVAKIHDISYRRSSDQTDYLLFYPNSRILRKAIGEK